MNAGTRELAQEEISSEIEQAIRTGNIRKLNAYKIIEQYIDLNEILFELQGGTPTSVRRTRNFIESKLRLLELQIMDINIQFN